MACEVGVEWWLSKIDLVELAKLRNIDGLTIKELMAHFKCGKTAVCENLRKSRNTLS